MTETTTAREKFEVGQRVRMTEKGITQRVSGVNGIRTGVVAGFPVAGSGDISKLVYIIRHGNRTKISYHMDFWEVATQ